MAINKAIIIGNVGADPIIRVTSNNETVAGLRVATTEKGYTLKNGTQVPDRTEWHSITAWGQRAEYIKNYITKGTKVYVEGSIHTREWEDKQGVKRYTTEIWADKIEGLSRPQAQTQAPTPTQAPAPAEPVQTLNDAFDLQPVQGELPF